MMQADHKTAYSRIPDEQLATLTVEEAMINSEINTHVPERMADFDEWDALSEATVDTTEWVSDDGQLAVHLEGSTYYSVKTHEATRTDPAAYKNVDCTVQITIWWSLNPTENPVVDIEVFEK